MKQTLIILFITLNHLSVSYAETTIGKCIVHESINGKGFIELNQNVIIYASDPDNGWCETKIFVIIDSKYVENNKIIKAGGILKDYYRNNPIIGRTLCDIYPKEIFTRSDGCFEVLINGFVMYKLIDLTSIPERALEKILQKSLSISDPIYVEFLNDYSFSKMDDIDTFHCWQLYDLIPEKGGIRIYIFYDNSNKIVAIMKERRMINYTFSNTISLSKNYQLLLTNDKLPKSFIDDLNLMINMSD